MTGPVPRRRPEDIECGERAAAARHRRRGEPLCDPCRAAEREYRNTRIEDARRYDRVAGRARRRLADRYPVEFNILFAREYAADVAATKKQEGTP